MPADVRFKLELYGPATTLVKVIQAPRGKYCFTPPLSEVAASAGPAVGGFQPPASLFGGTGDTGSRAASKSTVSGIGG
jgi:hypothetical protein